MDRSSEYNGDQLIATMAVFLSLTYISVLLRCYVRARITKSFQLDDWLMVVSQVIFTLSCIFLILGLHYGLGRHNSALSVDNQIEALKYQALATLTYIANMMFIKLSLAVFLLRIAVETRYIWILRISIVVVAIWSTAIFFYDLFECIPVQAQWDPTIMDAKCASAGSFEAAAYSISIMTILTDWLFALLPIPMIWSVQMSIQAKSTVVFVLSLGIFASVATLIRLRYIVQLTDVSELLYSGTTAMVWTLIEPGVAITAASLITIRPLMRALKLTGFESDPSRAGYHHSSRNQRQLSLRNDLSDRNWTATALCSDSAELKNLSARNPSERSKVSAGETIEEIGEGRRVAADAGSEEHILEGEEGIRRTVDFRIEHDRANGVEMPNR